MTSFQERWGTTVRRVLGEELYLFLAYALITLRPGASPPQTPTVGAIEPKPVPHDWTNDELQLFIEESRIDVATQQADKHDIRARAQVILTTALVVAGAAVTSYSGKKDLCLGANLLYGATGLAVGLAVLAAGGLISARSAIGTVSVPALTFYDTGEVLHTVAAGYASTRLIGARTVALMVTVLRDCVLALVVGAGLLAWAHLAY